MKKLIMLGVLVACAACVGPTTVVRTVDTRPAIAVVGAPAGAALYLDGVLVGDPGAYDGNPGVLRVEAGTHLLEIRVGATTTFSQRVFVESELKTVRVQ